MRGVVLICTVAFSAVGAVAYVGVFAAYNGEATMLAQASADPVSWADLVAKHGLATFLVLMGVLGVVSVWRFFKPHLGDLLVEWKTTVRKQGEFAENANTLLQKSVQADDTHGIILRETNGIVKQIYGEIVK